MCGASVTSNQNYKRDRDDDAIIQRNKQRKERNTLNLFTQFGVNLPTLREIAALRSTTIKGYKN
jgi:hypothetical protein